MKRIALLLVLFCLSFAAFPQNQVATLQHNDSITGVYYGPNALVSAYNAADNGDIISLSSGTFNPVNYYSKVLTLRGAGCVLDTLSNVLPTIIPGIYLACDNNIFEGIWFTGDVRVNGSNFVSNITFIKCNINKIYNYYNTVATFTVKYFQFNNCIINDYSTATFSGISLINSIVRFSVYSQIDISNPTTINNSIILFNNEQPINNILAYNSIIATSSEHDVSNCTFINCIGIETGETLLFEGQTTSNVMEVNDYSDVFETFDGTILYDNIYQLKNDIATSFLGNDGTEVGIYGGMMPYNPRATYMIMKRCNVAPRSTVDCKLSVDIEIISGDE